MKIREAGKSDFEYIWPMLNEVFSRGDTYAFSPETSKEIAYEIWMEKPDKVYVAVDEGKILGTYYLVKNQPGLGSHVCNAGYIVSSGARGKGLGKAMCGHSIDEARKLGFKAMQYNLVVCTNVNAIKLWKDFGFEIVGTIPKGFKHKELGYVDAYVMHREL